MRLKSIEELPVRDNRDARALGRFLLVGSEKFFELQKAQLRLAPRVRARLTCAPATHEFRHQQTCSLVAHLPMTRQPPLCLSRFGALLLLRGQLGHAPVHKRGRAFLFRRRARRLCQTLNFRTQLLSASLARV